MKFLKKLFNSKGNSNKAEETKLLSQMKAFFIYTDYEEVNAEKEAKELLDNCIKIAKKEKLYGVKNMGDTLIKDDKFLNKRLKASLTQKDILNYWNRDYIEILISNELSNVVKFATFLKLKEAGKSAKDATRRLRQMFAYFGDPEQSHKNYQGEDADIYPEFMERYEKWRDKYSAQELQEMTKKYSTYNAMIRELIGKGEL